MKKAIIILLLIFIPLFVFGDALKDCSKALDESNALLEDALKKIEQLESEKAALEKEIDGLKKDVESWKLIANEASDALGESNKVLQAANDRIDADQKEIIDLRMRIKDLLKAGTEFTTYHWNIMFLGGYPANVGIAAAYNLHFLPKVGIVVGFDYNFENNQPLLMAGIKINFE